METITKVSETEVKITKVTPEVIIPEKVEEETISLKDVKIKVAELDNHIAEWNGYRSTPITELAKIDAEIANLEAQKEKLLLVITEAEKQGVKESAPVKEAPLPAEEIIP